MKGRYGLYHSGSIYIVFMGGVADELNTVGGAFTIDGEKTSSAGNAAPCMEKNPPRVNREIYNK